MSATTASPKEKIETVPLLVISKGIMTEVQVPIKKKEDKIVEETDVAPTPEPPAELTFTEKFASAMGSALISCDAKLVELRAGAAESVLYQQNEKIKALEEANPKTLWLTRVAVKVTICDECREKQIACEHHPIDVTQWGAVETINLSQPQVACLYDRAMLDSYARMQPAKTGIRMLLLETLVVMNDKQATPLRYFVHYATKKQFDFNEKEFIRLHMADAVPTTHAGAQLQPNDIHVINVTWGFVVFAHTEDITKEPGEEEIKAAKKTRNAMDEAQDLYMQRRAAVRKQMLEAKAGALIDYTLHLMTPDLLKRIDAAGNFLPDRFFLRLPVEQRGDVLNLDRAVGVEHRDFQRVLGKAEADAVKAKKQHDILLEFAGDGIDVQTRKQIRAIELAGTPQLSEELRAEISSIMRTVQHPMDDETKARLEALRPAPTLLTDEHKATIEALRTKGFGWVDDAMIEDIRENGEQFLSEKLRKKIKKFESKHGQDGLAAYKKEVIAANNEELIKIIYSRRTFPTKEQVAIWLENARTTYESAANVVHLHREIDQQLSTVNPSDEICIQLIDSGTGHDLGIDVDVLYRIRVPYKNMRRAYAERLAAAAVAGKKKKETAQAKN